MSSTKERDGNDPIVENDLIVVHIDNKPGFFARIEEVVNDRKPGWWQVRLLPLGMDNLDFKTLVWILDDEQIRGSDYTMSGISMRIQKIPYYRKPEEKPSSRKDSLQGKVVSLPPRKK